MERVTYSQAAPTKPTAPPMPRAETLRWVDLQVLAPPVDLAAPGEHRERPPAARLDVHRHARERHLGLGPAEPIGETPTSLLTRSVRPFLVEGEPSSVRT